VVLCKRSCVARLFLGRRRLPRGHAVPPVVCLP